MKTTTQNRRTGRETLTGVRERQKVVAFIL